VTALPGPGGDLPADAAGPLGGSAAAGTRSAQLTRYGFSVDNAPGHHRAARWWTVATAVGWVLYFGITILTPANPLGYGPLLQLFSAALGILVLCALLMASQRPHWSRFARAVMFLCGVAIVLGLYALNAKGGIVPSFSALALMLIALPVGYWIGEHMERATHLVPLAIAMSLADIFSVWQGPTRKIADDVVAYHEQVAKTIETQGPVAAAAVRAPLADYVIVNLPFAGTGGSSPVLGVGDFIILAFLFRTAWVHHLNPARVFFSAVVSVMVALVTAAALDKPLPALPFIGLGTIGLLLLTDRRMRRLNKQEITLSIGVVVLFFALIAATYLQAPRA
jgi:hypothetical protein